MARQLSERLERIVSYCLPGDAADVGADHAYAALALLEEDPARRCIVTDVRKGPLGKAKAHLSEFSPRVSLRLGDGLDPLEPGEADTVILAGMGGNLIRSIMEKDMDKTRSFRRFVIQPRAHVAMLRQWLCELPFSFKEFSLVKEQGRLCEVFAVEPSDEKECLGVCGPAPEYLARIGDPLFPEYLDFRIAQAHTALDNLRNSKRADAGELTLEWEAKLSEYERIKRSL